MILSNDLMAILACPKCKGAVKESGEYIVCLNSNCGLRYPIRNGIPVMLIDEALPGIK